MLRILKSLFKEESGQGMVEYGLIIAAVAIAAIIGLNHLGKNNSDRTMEIAETMEEANDSHNAENQNLKNQESIKKYNSGTSTGYHGGGNSLGTFPSYSGGSIPRNDTYNKDGSVNETDKIGTVAEDATNDAPLLNDNAPEGNQAPIAKFYLNNENNLTVGYGIEIYNISTDPDDDAIVKEEWSGLPDGNKFTIAGTYEIKLRVADEWGNWSQWVKKTITVKNAKPIAVITSMPNFADGDTFDSAQMFSWSSSSSYDPDGHRIVEEEWYGKQNGYSQAGDHTVKLRVKDEYGEWSDWAEKTLNIVNGQRPVIIEGTISDAKNNTWSINNIFMQGEEEIPVLTSTKDIFFKTQLTVNDADRDTINALQYRIDGAVQTILYNVTASAQETQSVLSPTSTGVPTGNSLSTGTHSLELRVKDASGAWSDWTTPVYIKIINPITESDTSTLNAELYNFNTNSQTVMGSNRGPYIKGDFAFILDNPSHLDLTAAKVMVDDNEVASTLSRISNQDIVTFNYTGDTGLHTMKIQVADAEENWTEWMVKEEVLIETIDMSFWLDIYFNNAPGIYFTTSNSGTTTQTTLPSNVALSWSEGSFSSSRNISLSKIYIKVNEDVHLLDTSYIDEYGYFYISEDIIEQYFLDGNNISFQAEDTAGNKTEWSNVITISMEPLDYSNISIYKVEFNESYYDSDKGHYYLYTSNSYPYFEDLKLFVDGGFYDTYANFASYLYLNFSARNIETDEVFTNVAYGYANYNGKAVGDDVDGMDKYSLYFEFPASSLNNGTYEFTVTSANDEYSNSVPLSENSENLSFILEIEKQLPIVTGVTYSKTTSYSSKFRLFFANNFSSKYIGNYEIQIDGVSFTRTTSNSSSYRTAGYAYIPSNNNPTIYFFKNLTSGTHTVRARFYVNMWSDWYEGTFTVPEPTITNVAISNSIDNGYTTIDTTLTNNNNSVFSGMRVLVDDVDVTTNTSLNSYGATTARKQIPLLSTGSHTLKVSVLYRDADTSTIRETTVYTKNYTMENYIPSITNFQLQSKNSSENSNYANYYKYKIVYSNPYGFYPYNIAQQITVNDVDISSYIIYGTYSSSYAYVYIPGDKLDYGTNNVKIKTSFNVNSSTSSTLIETAEYSTTITLAIRPDISQFSFVEYTADGNNIKLRYKIGNPKLLNITPSDISLKLDGEEVPLTISSHSISNNLSTVDILIDMLNPGTYTLYSKVSLAGVESNSMSHTLEILDLTAGTLTHNNTASDSASYENFALTYTEPNTNPIVIKDIKIFMNDTEEITQYSKSVSTNGQTKTITITTHDFYYRQGTNAFTAKIYYGADRYLEYSLTENNPETLVAFSTNPMSHRIESNGTLSLYNIYASDHAFRVKYVRIREYTDAARTQLIYDMNFPSRYSPYRAGPSWYGTSDNFPESKVLYEEYGFFEEKIHYFTVSYITPWGDESLPRNFNVDKRNSTPSLNTTYLQYSGSGNNFYFVTNGIFSTGPDIVSIDVKYNDEIYNGATTAGITSSGGRSSNLANNKSIVIPIVPEMIGTIPQDGIAKIQWRAHTALGTVTEWQNIETDCICDYLTSDYDACYEAITDDDYGLAYFYPKLGSIKEINNEDSIINSIVAQNIVVATYTDEAYSYGVNINNLNNYSVIVTLDGVQQNVLKTEVTWISSVYAIGVYIEQPEPGIYQNLAVTLLYDNETKSTNTAQLESIIIADSAYDGSLYNLIDIRSINETVPAYNLSEFTKLSNDNLQTYENQNTFPSANLSTPINFFNRSVDKFAPGFGSVAFAEVGKEIVKPKTGTLTGTTASSAGGDLNISFLPTGAKAKIDTGDPVGGIYYKETSSELIIVYKKVYLSNYFPEANYAPQFDIYLTISKENGFGKVYYGDMNPWDSETVSSQIFTATNKKYAPAVRVNKEYFGVMQTGERATSIGDAFSERAYSWSKKTEIILPKITNISIEKTSTTTANVYVDYTNNTGVEMTDAGIIDYDFNEITTEYEVVDEDTIRFVNVPISENSQETLYAYIGDGDSIYSQIKAFRTTDPPIITNLNITTDYENENIFTFDYSNPANAEILAFDYTLVADNNTTYTPNSQNIQINENNVVLRTNIIPQGIYTVYASIKYQDFNIENYSLTYSKKVTFHSEDFSSSKTYVMKEIEYEEQSTDIYGYTVLYNGANDNSGTINLPEGHHINFGGVEYDKLYINSNGQINFTEARTYLGTNLWPNKNKTIKSIVLLGGNDLDSYVYYKLNSDNIDILYRYRKHGVGSYIYYMKATIFNSDGTGKVHFIGSPDSNVINSNTTTFVKVGTGDYSEGVANGSATLEKYTNKSYAWGENAPSNPPSIVSLTTTDNTLLGGHTTTLNIKTDKPITTLNAYIGTDYISSSSLTSVGTNEYEYTFTVPNELDVTSLSIKARVMNSDSEYSYWKTISVPYTSTPNIKVTDVLGLDGTVGYKAKVDLTIKYDRAGSDLTISHPAIEFIDEYGASYGTLGFDDFEIVDATTISVTNVDFGTIPKQIGKLRTTLISFETSTNTEFASNSLLQDLEIVNNHAPVINNIEFVNNPAEFTYGEGKLYFTISYSELDKDTINGVYWKHKNSESDTWSSSYLISSTNTAFEQIDNNTIKVEVTDQVKNNNSLHDYAFALRDSNNVTSDYTTTQVQHNKNHPMVVNNLTDTITDSVVGATLTFGASWSDEDEFDNEDSIKEIQVYVDGQLTKDYTTAYITDTNITIRSLLLTKPGRYNISIRLLDKYNALSDSESFEINVAPATTPVLYSYDIDPVLIDGDISLSNITYVLPESSTGITAIEYMLSDETESHTITFDTPINQNKFSYTLQGSAISEPSSELKYIFVRIKDSNGSWSDSLMGSFTVGEYMGDLINLSDLINSTWIDLSSMQTGYYMPSAVATNDGFYTYAYIGDYENYMSFMDSVILYFNDIPTANLKEVDSFMLSDFGIEPGDYNLSLSITYKGQTQSKDIYTLKVLDQSASNFYFQMQSTNYNGFLSNGYYQTSLYGYLIVPENYRDKICYNQGYDYYGHCYYDDSLRINFDITTETGEPLQFSWVQGNDWIYNYTNNTFEISKGIKFLSEFTGNINIIVSLVPEDLEYYNNEPIVESHISSVPVNIRSRIDKPIITSISLYNQSKSLPEPNVRAGELYFYVNHQKSTTNSNISLTEIYVDDATEPLAIRYVNSSSKNSGYINYSEVGEHTFKFYLTDANNKKSEVFEKTVNIVRNPTPTIRVLNVDGEEVTFDTYNNTYTLTSDRTLTFEFIQDETDPIIYDSKILSINNHSYSIGDSKTIDFSTIDEGIYKISISITYNSEKISKNYTILDFGTQILLDNHSNSSIYDSMGLYPPEPIYVFGEEYSWIRIFRAKFISLNTSQNYNYTNLNTFDNQKTHYTKLITPYNYRYGNDDIEYIVYKKNLDSSTFYFTTRLDFYSSSPDNREQFNFYSITFYNRDRIKFDYYKISDNSDERFGGIVYDSDHFIKFTKDDYLKSGSSVLIDTTSLTTINQ